MIRQLLQQPSGHAKPTSPADATTSVPFPKIVALCGASTALGSQLLDELFHSEQVAQIHAIATDDVPLVKRLDASIIRKGFVTIIDADRPDKALGRIKECDVAYCVMTTDRHASSSMSPAQYRAINYEVPVKFITRMFELGVLHITLLSHTGADKKSRSEFYTLKGELEAFLNKMRKDAGDFAPMATLYRMPSNIMAAPLSPGDPSVSQNRRSKDGELFPVDVNQVATVMLIDGFEKASLNNAVGYSRRMKNSFQLFEAEDVHEILSESAHRGGPWTALL